MLVSFVKDMVFFLPSSKSLSYNWNFGMMLGFVLVLQLLTGFFLVFYYVPDYNSAFLSVQYLMIESNFGWLMRLYHFNGASLFFFFLYLHFFKGLFYGSWRLTKVWFSGLTIFIILMAVAFMGYVLVWAQMSFWASVVITSLLSVIPLYGPVLVTWIWGGFGVTGATLKFFFALHFILPWVLALIVMIHLFLLHDTGSTSSLFCHGDYDKVIFFSFYWWKDCFNFLVFFFFSVFVFTFPFILGDPEMFIEADPMVSPVHIVPEWYFLFAYAILRAIPNKVFGVIVMLLSLLVFYFFGFLNYYISLFNLYNKFYVFNFLFLGIFLSWLGQCLVEFPFLHLSMICSVLYFFIILFSVFFFFVSSIIFS